MLLYLSEVAKWYLTCVSSYNLDPMFRPRLVKGPNSPFIANRNLERSENNYKKCYYLDLDL